MFRGKIGLRAELLMDFIAWSHTVVHMCEWKDNKHIMRHNVWCYESSTFFCSVAQEVVCNCSAAHRKVEK